MLLCSAVGAALIWVSRGLAGESLARPKSRILTRPSLVTKRFSGFRSRWTIPFSWAAATARDLDSVIDRLTDGERAAFEEFPQSISYQQFGDKIRRTFEDTETVDGENVGMVECGCRLCLLLETAKAVLILRDEGGQDLDGYFALKDLIAGAIDLAHAARSERAEELIAIQLRAWVQVHP